MTRHQRKQAAQEKGDRVWEANAERQRKVAECQHRRVRHGLCWDCNGVVDKPDSVTWDGAPLGNGQ